MKKLTLLVAVALMGTSALMTSCQKERNGQMTLITESFVSDESKLSVSSLTGHSSWVTGDELRINGDTYTVTVDNNTNKASISNVTIAEDYYAVYPASLCGALTSENATLNLPATYQYHVQDGQQIIDLPMVGHLDGDSEGPLYLKHATGALVIRPINGTSNDMYIDTVQVISNSYALNGQFSVNVSNPGSTGLSTSDADRRVVTVLFTEQNLLIPADGTGDVIVPVPPVGSGNRFTIRVVGHTRLLRYTFVRTQSEAHGGAMLRNEMGYAATKLNASSGNIYCTTTDILDREGSNLLIKTPDDYVFLVDACHNGWTNQGSYSSKSYKLANNIDMSGYTVGPLEGFTGSFDGDGHSISNLNIVSDYTINSTGRVAMIATATTSNVVTNLTLNNVSVTYTGSASACMAGIVAYDASSTAYSNCHVNGLAFYRTSSGNIEVGGIIGRQRSYAKTFTNCGVSNVVWAGNSSTQFGSGMFVGGFIGTSDQTLTFNSCNLSSDQPITIYANTTRWGGLAGEHTASSLTVNGCNIQSNVALIRSSTVYCGGLVGRVTSAYTINYTGTTTVGGYIYARASTYHQNRVVGNSDEKSVTENGTYTYNLTLEKY